MKKTMRRYIDTGSMIVIIVTFVLFTVALFVKGLTKDMLLEAGVLLVSIKLIMMNFKSAQNMEFFKNELDEIKELLKEKN
jgi:hypothetical protein